MSTERDTHFQEFAWLLFPEISSRFFTLYARIEEHRPIEELDAIEDEIRTLLAQRAYDLAIHVQMHTNISVNELEAAHITPQDNVKAIPDMTEWPPT